MSDLRWKTHRYICHAKRELGYRIYLVSYRGGREAEKRKEEAGEGREAEEGQMG